MQNAPDALNYEIFDSLTSFKSNLCKIYLHKSLKTVDDGATHTIVIQIVMICSVLSLRFGKSKKQHIQSHLSVCSCIIISNRHILFIQTV